MKATRIEFRLRYLIHIVLYALGFFAPWDRWLHLDHNRTAWLLLASWSSSYQPSSHQWLSFTAATVTVLIAGTLIAFLAAALRTWAAAYLGSSIVQDKTMHGHRIVVAGPYRYVRNPLYLGTILHTLALALLMPFSGAIFAIVCVTLFEIRLAVGEEAFLTEKLGEPYIAYRNQVPRLIPSITSRVPATPIQPKWPTAFLGEIYFWGVAISFAAIGWRYNSLLIIQGVLISFGISLVASAFIPKER